MDEKRSDFDVRFVEKALQVQMWRLRLHVATHHEPIRQSQHESERQALAVAKYVAVDEPEWKPEHESVKLAQRQSFGVALAVTEHLAIAVAFDLAYNFTERLAQQFALVEPVKQPVTFTQPEPERRSVAVTDDIAVVFAVIEPFGTQLFRWQTWRRRNRR